VAIDGHRSTYPTSLDDWGAAYENNQCQRFHASRWNTIEDAIYNLERHTRRVLLTGEANSIHTDPGNDRPKLLVRTFVVVVTGTAAETKTVSMPALTAGELAHFGGKPFEAGNNVQLFARGIPPHSGPGVYVAGLKSPINDDSSGQQIVLAPTRDSAGDEDNKVPPGSFIITMLITR
jgi:hypothetical protein